MKKTVLLLSLLLLVVAAQAQQTDASSANPAAEPSPEGTLPTSVSFPIERVQTPTFIAPVFSANSCCPTATLWRAA